MPFDPLYLLLLALAATRVTRLFVLDTITEPLRVALMRWEFTDDLISCPWCIGFWIGAAHVVAFLLWRHTPFFQLHVLVFALSQVIGLIHSFDDAIHERDDISVSVEPSKDEPPSQIVLTTHEER